MNMKRTITAVLLLFVGVSFAAILFRNNSNDSQQPEDTAQMGAADPDVDGGTDPAITSIQEASADAVSETSPTHTVVAYYFHGNYRCATCRKLEAYGKEALEAAFPAELQNGTIVWKVVNVEEPANEHFVKDYQLSTRSIVLSDRVSGKEAAYVNLSEIWNLVGDKDAYLAYVQEAVRGLLGNAS